MTYQTTNPYDGKTLKVFDELSDRDLENAIARAARCFRPWRDKGFAGRAAIATKAAAILRDRTDEFARLVTLEMGKLIGEARAEVALSADIIDYFARHAEEFLAPERLDTASGEASLESPPLGVLFGVQPWNFPYYQLARFAAPSLMAGNVLMIKHASNVPQCALAFEKLWAEAGAPAGAYTNLMISKEQVERIINDPRVQGVALTGGSAAGSAVASRAGRALKKNTMELGGSDPLIVLEDADLEKTVEWAVWGRMHNAGQSCVASKRFIVVEKLARVFLDRFEAALASLKPGDPMDEATTLAPLSSEAALDNLLDQVSRAIEGGAKVALGGRRLNRPGAFMEPTILTDVTPDNPVYHEELFGPVAMFFPVKDEAEAVAIANDSPYGLGGAVFTNDIERGKRLAQELDSGMVFINHPTWTAPELPFGGIKQSGYGRELSYLGIKEFVNKKLIRVAEIGAPP
jgi:succinate-semialdehyde dehydrogenase/glutarate-semialdehyde dehydrogenase